MLSKCDYLSSYSAPPPTLVGTVKRWHWILKAQSQCISAAQCSLHKHLPLLVETPGAFPLSILSSTYSWGRVSAIMKKSTEFNHTGLKGSGRAGWELTVKNNICTLWQLHQNCNPIEEAHENLTKLQWVLCLCLLRCFHHFYLCQPDIQEPTPASLLGFALSLLEPTLSLCTVGCKCLWINLPLGSARDHWLMIFIQELLFSFNYGGKWGK